MARQSLYDYKRDGVLGAIETLRNAKGRSPSIREISDVAGVSVATLHSYLTRMQKEGLVEWASRTHRSLRVTPLGQSSLSGSSLTASASSASTP